MSEVVVHSRGPRRTGTPFIIGERPGAVEASTGRPFSGPSGREQDRYLSQGGLSSTQFYITNVCRSYDESNADPLPADIARWSPELERDIAEIRPRYIIAAGRFAMRWFLGDDFDLDMVYGTPQYSQRAPGSIILSIYHPAFALHDGDKMSLVSYGYQQACAIINGKRGNVPTADHHLGVEQYLDLTGTEFARQLRLFTTKLYPALALDTEGYPDDPWSIQISVEPGRAYVLRYSQPDFAVGIAALQQYCLLSGVTVVLHNAMYDIEMCRAMGLDLSDPHIHLFDTRYAAYIMRTEPQGLKPLLYRWCGMRQPSYDDTIGPVALEQQLDYLGRILEIDDWAPVEPRIEHSNDGTSRLYTPQAVSRRAEAILVDYYSGKTDKDGNRISVPARWRQVDAMLRNEVEARLGRMPVGTLNDIPLDKAIHYGARDADGTLRLFYVVEPELKRRGLSLLMRDGCQTLPVFEEMQSNGILADRHYCERMSDTMWTQMCKIGARISHRYYQGAPFNPASSDQVAALMRRRGLVGEKRSKKTGKMSTGKKSIEHLRYSDDAMADVIDWREHQKMRDSFYDPIAERLGTQDQGRIRTHLNPYSTVSRRISSSNPNLTAIPVRNELGIQVRDGFIAPDGMMLGAYDLSQIEMRYICHISNDPLMRKFFTSINPKTGKPFDMHAETAARIFGVDIRDVDEKKQRYPAKRAGFGVATNIQGAGLLDQLRMFGCEGWTVDKCDELIDEWLNVYTGVRKFLDDCKAEVRQHGVIRDYWGMPRYLPGVWSSDRRLVAEAERAASSMKIQGGAQGLIQKSMAWIFPHVRDLRAAGVNIKLLLQIHDEILVEADESMTEPIGDLLVEALTEHCGLKLNVPVKASGNWSKTWGKLK